MQNKENIKAGRCSFIQNYDMEINDFKKNIKKSNQKINIATIFYGNKFTEFSWWSFIYCYKERLC
jgi:hypothetical protein